jgi:hypothetical protein
MSAHGDWREEGISVHCCKPKNGYDQTLRLKAQIEISDHEERNCAKYPVRQSIHSV